MDSAPGCLGYAAEGVENVSERLASGDHLEQTPLAGEKRLREFQVVDGDRLHCASLTMRLVGRNANHTLVSESGGVWRQRGHLADDITRQVRATYRNVTRLSAWDEEPLCLVLHSNPE